MTKYCELHSQRAWTSEVCQDIWVCSNKAHKHTQLFCCWRIHTRNIRMVLTPGSIKAGDNWLISGCEMMFCTDLSPLHVILLWATSLVHSQKLFVERLTSSLMNFHSCFSSSQLISSPFAASSKPSQFSHSTVTVLPSALSRPLHNLISSPEICLSLTRSSSAESMLETKIL